MAAATLRALHAQRPWPTAQAAQQLCADKGYDYPTIERLVAQWGYTAHIRSRGEEGRPKRASGATERGAG